MYKEILKTKNYKILAFPDLEGARMTATPAWKEILNIMEEELNAGWSVINIIRGIPGIMFRRIKDDTK